jgi:hypothetical protein
MTDKWNITTIEHVKFACPDPCGHTWFEIEMSNGIDGKTFSLWLLCRKCGNRMTYKRGMERLEAI